MLNHESDLYIAFPVFLTQDSGNIAEVETERWKEPQAKDYWTWQNSYTHELRTNKITCRRHAQYQAIQHSSTEGKEVCEPLPQLRYY